MTEAGSAAMLTKSARVPTGSVPTVTKIRFTNHKLKKHVDSFQQYLREVRGSEVSPDLFDGITDIDAYGKGTGSDLSLKW